MSQSSFARDMFAWLDQIADDRALPTHAPLLAIVLRRYVNKETGEAWPAISTLASALGMAENSVRSALRAMVENGHLLRSEGGGKATNRYRPVIKDADWAKKVKGDETAGPLHGGEPLPLHGGEPLQNNTLTPSPLCSPPPFTLLNPNNMNQPY